jgi:hypothetical protein
MVLALLGEDFNVIHIISECYLELSESRVCLVCIVKRITYSQNQLMVILIQRSLTQIVRRGPVLEICSLEHLLEEMDFECLKLLEDINFRVLR